MKNLIFKLLILQTFLFFGKTFAQNQIDVTIRIKGEAVKKVTDLANNRTLTVVLKNNMNFPMTVWVRSSLTNTAGLNIQNKSAFKPSNGISLGANATYILSSNEIQEVFNTNNLQIKIGDLNADLPAGDYTLCLKVIDFVRPTNVWSDNNCQKFTINAPIKVETTTVPARETPTVTDVPAPNLIKPLRDEEIKARDRQNVLFTWAGGSNSPSNTKYLFRIVEYSDTRQSAMNAFENSRNAYEENTSQNLLTLGSKDYELKPNTRYLWGVTAYIPDNNGRIGRIKKSSEVRVFTYKAEDVVAKKEEKREPAKEEKIDPKPKDTKVVTVPKTVPVIKKPLSEYKIELGVLNQLSTLVKGKLLYAFPEDYQLEKIKNANNDYSILSKSNFSSKEGKGGNFMYSVKEYTTSSYLNPTANSKPLPNTKLSLVMVYAVLDTKNNYNANPYMRVDNNWKIITGFYDTDFLIQTINGQKIKELSKVLATTKTNEKGEFEFNYMMKDTCDFGVLKIREKDKIIHTTDEKGNYKEVVEPGSTLTEALVLKTCILVVESPYYCSPVMFINPKIGQVLNLPEQVSLIKSYELALKVMNDEAFSKALENKVSLAEAKKGASLEGINMEVFKMKPSDPNMPNEEGQNLPQSAIQSLNLTDFATDYPTNKIENVVAVGKTNIEGEFVVPRCIKVGEKDESFVAHAFTSKSTGVYNFNDGFKNISILGNDNSGNSGFYENFNKYFQFNTSFQYERENFDMLLTPRQPKILGRTVENAMALSGVTTFLLTKKSKSSSSWFGNYSNKINDQIEAFQNMLNGYPQIDGYDILAVKVTDKDGYFEFDNLTAGDYKLVFQKDGYKTKYLKQEENSKELDPNSIITIQNGTLMQLNEVAMIASGKVMVCVDDEDKKRVIADLRIDNGPMYATGSDGIFKGCVYIPAPAGKNRTLKVYPRSDEYFNEEYKIDVEDEGVTNIKAGTIIVRKRLHRMNITVIGKQGANEMPIEGATVEIVSQGITQKTNSKGEIYAEFGSPGKWFLVRVTPPKGSNWTFAEKELFNFVSKTPFKSQITLSPAREILAQVSDAAGKPLKDAKVYVKNLKSYWNDKSTNYAECMTDASGGCKLQGIPQDENNVEVFASKEGITDGLSYVGDKKTAFWFNGSLQAKVDFKLQSQAGFAVNDIWGFPVLVEAIKPLGNEAFEVSGTLIELPATLDFKSLDKETKVEFKNVKFVKNPSGSNSHQPEMDFIKTQSITLPIRIGQNFQGKVSAQSKVNGLTNESLVLKKGADGRGEIASRVELDLSSFEGSYQLKGKIEVAESLSNPKVTVFKSSKKEIVNGIPIATEIAQKKKYLIGRVEGNSLQNLDFKVHNFTAEGIAAKSYLYGDSVRLFSVLHTNIPTMQPADIALEAGYITILPNKIDRFEGGNNITFSLEKWKVSGLKSNKSFAWEYDQNNGGIVIPRASVNTGIFTVELKSLIIKPDKIIVDNIDLDSKNQSSLTLGGFVPIEITNGSKFKFSYDPVCYHDYKPHWKLSLLAGPNQKYAARVGKLDGMEDGQTIDFGSMNLYSDNQQQFNEGSQKTLVFKKVLNFSLTTIDVQQDFFTMLGTASMNIPNMSNNGGGIYGQIVYSKGANGKPVFNFKPLNFGIEGKGQVSFKPLIDIKNQKLTNGKFEAVGTIKVYDSQTNTSFNLDGRLLHEKVGNGFKTSIEVLDNQKVPLGSKFLFVRADAENSAMRVVNSDWENLRLKTVMPNDANGFQMLDDNEKNRTMTLVVKGAIETDPSSGIVGLKGMDTGMGSISLFYDFTRQEMRGNFFVKPAVPINFGLVNLTSSNVSMAVGSNGFFMMCNGTGEIALPGGLPLPVDAGLNFVAGYYTTQLPQEDINTLVSLSVKKALPSFMKNGIKGMYSSVNLNSVPFDDSFSIGISGVANVSCWAKAGAAYEYRSYMNYANGSVELGAGNYAYASFDVGGEAEILSMVVSGHAHLDFQAALDSKLEQKINLDILNVKEKLKGITLTGCASVTASFDIEACAFGECIGGSVSKSISSIFGIEQGKPTFRFQFQDCGNGLPAMKLNDSGY